MYACVRLPAVKEVRGMGAVEDNHPTGMTGAVVICHTLLQSEGEGRVFTTGRSVRARAAIRGRAPLSTARVV